MKKFIILFLLSSYFIGKKTSKVSKQSLKKSKKLKKLKKLKEIKKQTNKEIPEKTPEPVEDLSGYNILFNLKNEKNLFIDCLYLMEKILIKKPIENLLFLNLLLKNYQDKKVILKILFKYEKLFEILFKDQENNLQGEVNQIMEFFLEDESMNEFLTVNKISPKFFEKFLRLVVITKTIIFQNAFREATFATNYNLKSLNINKIFTSRKMFYIFILTPDQYTKMKFNNPGKVIPINKKFISHTIEKLKNINYKKYFIEKNSPEFDFLKVNEMFYKKIFINGQMFYKVVVAYSNMEEKVNNSNFSFLEIEFESFISEEGLHKILNQLNKIKTTEILLTINKIFSTKDLNLINYKTHEDTSVESVANNPEILDIIINFPTKKYLLIPQENSYILYLIFNVVAQKDNVQNLKNTKDIMKYVYKTLVI